MVSTTNETSECERQLVGGYGLARYRGYLAATCFLPRYIRVDLVYIGVFLSLFYVCKDSVIMY